MNSFLKELLHLSVGEHRKQVLYIGGTSDNTYENINSLYTDESQNCC